MQNRLNINFPSDRQVRAQQLIWQRRIIFGLGGLMVGLAAVGLAIGADACQEAFREMIRRYPYSGLAVTPLGFGLVVWITNRYFPGTQGSGIPQAIAARKLKHPAKRIHLVGIRTAVGKVLMTMLGLAVGASTGREGPTVQVGAAIMFLTGRIAPKRQVGLILAGAAAGVAGAFNTPLAGIVFAIEEMSRSFEMRTSGMILGTVIFAGLTSMSIFGNYTYFGTTHDVMQFGMGWIAVPVIGVAGGLLGGLFSRILIIFTYGLPGRAGQLIKKWPVLFAILCGLIVALASLVSHGAVNGAGYEAARDALHDDTSLSLIYAPLKFLATTISSIAGLPGGIFSPSLSIGAGVGADLAPLFPNVPIGVIILLGMVAYFTGVVQAPITAFVIVMEMTDNHQMMLPLMACALIANGSSKLLCKEGVYHAQSGKFLAFARQRAEDARLAAEAEEERLRAQNEQSEIEPGEDTDGAAEGATEGPTGDASDRDTDGDKGESQDKPDKA
ncbi:H+/Cl- antiporter ClcA [Cohaesibacter sp. ES.047]|uniref:chloride channel protein n=1 Tax=Cohaesibacter sp. ES.047 TaxID=1798205 RepID=UPI000BB8AD0C|nr:chloride channel protein [Cohaesibacter sp. ES.047]SNY94353.1 H+/Cl- antiporter ClcA [Cohaesibacter sp. ES.047]